MTFTHRIKQEIMINKMSKNQAIHFIIGICYSIAYIKNDNYVLKIKNTIISDGINNILKKLNIEIIKYNTENSWIIFPTNLLPPLEIPNMYLSQFSGGLFLGGGSVADSKSSSYHLEIRINNQENIKNLITFFNNHRFYFNSANRVNHHIIYIKKSDQISDFLRAIGSYGGIMEFEDLRISRDFKNNINRIANLEVNNQYKIIKASKTQIKLFNNLKSNNKYTTLKNNYKLLIELRLSNPLSSLSELSDIFYKVHNIKTTKSILNNWINQLKKIKL